MSSLGNNTTQSYTTLHNTTPYLWRELTKQDINSIVCHCAVEYNANITSREVVTALQSDIIPDVHPLREYILSLEPYTPGQIDWIDFVAQQVTVRDLQCSASKTNYSTANYSTRSAIALRAGDGRGKRRGIYTPAISSARVLRVLHSARVMRREKESKVVRCDSSSTWPLPQASKSSPEGL